MPNDKKSIEIKMLDNVFNVKVDGNEDYIREISNFVNSELGKLDNGNPHVNKIHIALLGCMNITDLLFQARDDVHAAEEKAEKNVEALEILGDEVEGLKATIARMKEEKLGIDQEKEVLRKEIEDKNELLNQYREHLKQAKVESETNRKSILSLQNKLFESQIELSKSKESGGN